MSAEAYEPEPFIGKARSMERIIIVVGQGYGQYVARDILSRFAQYGCDVLYEEDRDGEDIVEVWAEYITAEVEKWLGACEPVKNWKRYDIILLEIEG